MEVADLVLGVDAEIMTDDFIKFRQDGDVEFIFYRRSYREVLKFYQYCHAHHMDIYGLIDNGLAIKVTEENNPYKQYFHKLWNQEQ